MLVFGKDPGNKKPRFFKFAGKFLWAGVRKIKVTVNERGYRMPQIFDITSIDFSLCLLWSAF
jgi:hypothetical protein